MSDETAAGIARADPRNFVRHLWKKLLAEEKVRFAVMSSSRPFVV